MENQKYFDLNKQLWDTRTRAHLESAFYDNDSFLKGRNTLTKVELQTLGDVSGKSIIHLQCHFGQDTLSLARMGASTLGVDISTEAIKYARKFNDQLGLDSRFLVCNVLETLDYVKETFDIVFVTFGATCWLPNLDQWATVVSNLLKPGGYLYYHEFHPTFYILDDKTKKIGYPYFNTGAMVEESESSYTDNSANMNLKEVFWSHSMSELISACLKTGLRIDLLNEYDYSPYNCFDNMEERAPGEFVMDINGIRLPHTLELIATKV
jgi:SAM-dependent methyltransferase